MLAEVVVKSQFLGTQLHLQGNLRLLWQFVEHILLGATKQEWGKDTSQESLLFLVVVTLDGQYKAVCKLLI